MTAIPRSGPIARTGNAQRQPIEPAISGTHWIVIVVSRKPNEVWSVSAVPTACGGAESATMALNCAESATTKKPQTQAIAVTTQTGAPKARPMPSEHAALAAMDRLTTRA